MRELAGLLSREKWKGSILRHTAGSHLWQLWKDEGRLVAHMGHDIRTHLRHYRRAVTDAQMIAFWQGVPEGAPKPKIIRAA